jgi:hypothetical protein
LRVGTYDIEHRVEINQKHDGRDQIRDESDDKVKNALIPEHPPETGAARVP